MSTVRPTLIAYTTKTRGYPEFDQFRVTYSNPTFFQNPAPHGKYDYFYTESDEIRERYKLAESKTKEYKLDSEEAPKRKSKAVESQVSENIEQAKEPEQVEPEESYDDEQQDIPEDYAELSWPKLRSLASKFTDEKGINKERALEILAEQKDK